MAAETFTFIGAGADENAAGKFPIALMQHILNRRAQKCFTHDDLSDNGSRERWYRAGQGPADRFRDWREMSVNDDRAD
jgi:hypothetical protein